MSRYVNHLPAIFQEDPFLGQFLLAFERILTGLKPSGDPPNLPPIPPGLEEILDSVDSYFDPRLARPDFLPWLAGWVATSLRDDWDEDTRRGFLANIIPLYRKRGTKEGLQMMLQIYLDPKSDPKTNNQSVQILEAPALGDSDQTPYPPRYFQVRFAMSEHDPLILARRAAIATYIIDREKPAHTYYGLRISFPSLQISDPPSFGTDGKPDHVRGVFVGTNTTLGSAVFKP